MSFNTLIAFLIMSLAFSGCSNHTADSPEGTASIKTRALDELRHNLKTQSRWEKVHAAEYLLWAGFPEGVQEEYEGEAEKFGNESPYRIGIWRVLAQCATNAAERRKYVERILQAFKDRDGSDRLHAAETLAKLRVSLLESARTETEEILKGEQNALFLYSLAGAAINPEAAGGEHHARLVEITTSGEGSAQLRTQGAYALRHLGVPSRADWEALAAQALKEPEASSAKIYLLSAAFVTAPKDTASFGKIFSDVHENLIKAKHSPSKGARAEMAVALGDRGTSADLPVLLSLLNNDQPLNSNNLRGQEDILASPENADVRSAAAYGILRITEREK